jgi:hypothetical protein
MEEKTKFNQVLKYKRIKLVVILSVANNSYGLIFNDWVVKFLFFFFVMIIGGCHTLLLSDIYDCDYLFQDYL